MTRISSLVPRSRSYETSPRVPGDGRDRVIDGERHTRAIELLDRMVSMLTGLIKKPL